VRQRHGRFGSYDALQLQLGARYITESLVNGRDDKPKRPVFGVIAKIARSVTQSRLVTTRSNADADQPVHHHRFVVTSLTCRAQVLLGAE
jgi:hypothetical protein